MPPSIRAVVSPPDLVTTLMTEDAERPSSAREPVRRELKFLHGVLRQILQRPADDIVVVVRAVDGHVAAATELAGRRDQNGVRFRRIEVRRGRIAGDEERQLQEVAAVEGQRRDFLLPDDGVNG